MRGGLGFGGTGYWGDFCYEKMETSCLEMVGQSLRDSAFVNSGGRAWKTPAASAILVVLTMRVGLTETARVGKRVQEMAGGEPRRLPQGSPGAAEERLGGSDGRDGARELRPLSTVLSASSGYSLATNFIYFYLSCMYVENLI